MDKTRVLIVDDEPHLRALIRACLSATGSYELVESASGEEALATAGRQPFDLVLMDVRMPGIGGLEACRQLRHQPATRHVPVVFVSAWSSESDVHAAREAGGSAFLAKPFDIDHLVRLAAQVGRQVGQESGG